DVTAGGADEVAHLGRGQVRVRAEQQRRQPGHLGAGPAGPPPLPHPVPAPPHPLPILRGPAVGLLVDRRPLASTAAGVCGLELACWPVSIRLSQFTVPTDKTSSIELTVQMVLGEHLVGSLLQSTSAWLFPAAYTTTTPAATASSRIWRYGWSWGRPGGAEQV